MGDPRDTTKAGKSVNTLYGSVSKTCVPPNAPAGGGGNGHFTSRLPYGKTKVAGLHQQAAPAARAYEPQPGYSVSELWDGAVCISEARFLAEFRYAPGAILKETGRALSEILEGILPGLIMTGCAVAVCTLLGAVIGGVVGFFAFGAGAVPGAAIGAEVGFDAGVALVTYAGLGFMLVYVVGSLGDVTSAMVEGVGLAWDARGRPAEARRAGVHAGAEKMAHGIAIFFRLVLEAIVMFLLEKGAAAVTARLSELMVKLKASDFGSGFPEWVGKNYKGLIEDPKVNPNLRAKKSQGGAAPKEGGGAAPKKGEPGKTTATETKTSGAPAKSGKPKTTEGSSQKLRNKYQKRTPEEVAKLRKEFDGKNGARSKFVKEYADSPEAARRFTPAQLEKMKKTGQTPKGWVVHHKQPLFRGGDNSMGNMRVMKDTFHRTHSKKLHYYPEGKNPYGRH